MTRRRALALVALAALAAATACQRRSAPEVVHTGPFSGERLKPWPDRDHSQRVKPPDWLYENGEPDPHRTHTICACSRPLQWELYQS